MKDERPSYLYEQLRDLATQEPLVYTILAQQRETGEPDMQAAIRLIRALTTKVKTYEEMAIENIKFSLNPGMQILMPRDNFYDDERRGLRGKERE